MKRTNEDRPARRARIDAGVKAAFLAAVREGVRLEEGARRTGCSLPGLYGARARDEAFAKAWQEALAVSAAGERGDGERVRIAANGRRRLQARRMRHVRFTEARKLVFLQHFAGTCDATAAAKAAGVDESTIYKHRQRDPAFAADFQEALEQGYARLEAEAVRQRIAAQARLRDGIMPAGEMAQEFERVMKLLDRWDRRGGGTGMRGIAHGRQRGTTFEEAIEALARKLKALDIPVRAGEGAEAGRGEG